MATLRVELPEEILTLENVGGVQVQEGILYVTDMTDHTVGVFAKWNFAVAIESLSEADR